MKLSDYVLNFLIRNKVTHIFNLAGGSIAHLLDSMYQNTKIKSVVVRHEQAGAFAAEGYSRITGNIGVAMATSGPGATNMITGIASAFFDSVPMLYLTGQVNTYEYKFNNRMRQRGFQETDIVSMIKPITKFACRVVHPIQIRYILEKAVFLAKSQRPGPVLIDLPMDIQRADVKEGQLITFYGSKEHKLYCKRFPSRVSSEEQAKIRLFLKKARIARRPLILAGGGLRASGSVGLFDKFSSLLRFPVVCSLMGLDVMDHSDPRYCGMIGSYGNRYANITVANCDLLLVLGSRLDTRQTGTRPATFAREADIFHVDIDPAELAYRKFHCYHPVLCDLPVFFQQCIHELERVNDHNIRGKEWMKAIQRFKEGYSREKYPPMPVDIQELFDFLSEQSSVPVAYTLDVGQHQMWASQSLRLKKQDRLITCGGLGSMGFGLPAAIGAFLAKPRARQIMIAGDGGFQMNLQELETVKHYHIPLKMIVVNNHCLGMVREFQEIYFKKRYQSTVKGYSCVSFQRTALAYQIPYVSFRNTADFKRRIRGVLGKKGPVIIEVNLPQKTSVFPKLLVDRPVEDQNPPVSRMKLLKDMFVKPMIRESIS
ncbi:MAG: thiamine pyrophosphate-binding protein [bacterium]|nr:thiamine pyrophosphate-binding protein [bacterium]